MLERLKQPFWFGLPLYAWVAGGAALVLGVGYFAFFARSHAAATTPQQDTSGGNIDPLNPYPNPGGGATVPPTPAFDPNGAVIYSQPSSAYLTPSDPIYTPTSAMTPLPGSRVSSAPTTATTGGSPAASGVVAVGGYLQRSVSNLVAALPRFSTPAPAAAPVYVLPAPTPSRSGRSL